MQAPKNGGVDWVERLQATNIGASICEKIKTIRAYNSRPADGTRGTGHSSYTFAVFTNHFSGHSVTLLDPFAFRPRRGKIYALVSAEKYNAHTRAILQATDHTGVGIRRLIDISFTSESCNRNHFRS